MRSSTQPCAFVCVCARERKRERERERQTEGERERERRAPRSAPAGACRVKCSYPVVLGAAAQREAIHIRP